jgi:hypothetical protein
VTSQSTATLRSRYVEQAASDLEEVRRQQHELTEKIKVLQQEEALLVDILSLAGRTLADEEHPLPEQARDEPAPAPARPSTTTATTVGAATPATGARAASRGAARRASGSGGSRGASGGAAKKKAGRPLLGDLLMGLLESHDEPRLAKELRDELLEKHPDRTPTPQVVRNTLEALVAKGRIRRHRQQRSVMYSPVQSARPAAAKN